MSLRFKIVMALVGLTVAVTTAIGILSYNTTKAELAGEVDSSLRTTADQVAQTGEVDRVGDDHHDGFRSRSDVIVQSISSDGTVSAVEGAALPVSATDLAIAAGDDDAAMFNDVTTDDGTIRVLTASVDHGGGAVQVGRNLSEIDQVLAALRTRILVASLLVVAIAAAIGSLLAQQLTRRIVRLTDAAEHVAATGSLAVDVPVDGADEAARLGTAFRGMLAALARSRDDQQRLVQDVGHELRTPLTSVRTNVYTLRYAHGLDPSARERVLADLDSESMELTRLINEVIEVATDRRSAEPDALIELGPLIDRVATRARQRSGRAIDVHVGDDPLIPVRPRAVERAVTNLVENALKFDDTDGPIDITCDRGRIDVADRGPGIPTDDREHVFDRFYRATTARGLPGSGLGLSIVQTIADSHGGRAWVTDRPGGGTIVTIELPVPTSARTPELV